MSSERQLSHAKDVIGLLEAGYATHIPIAFTDIIPKGTNGTQIINVKGRNLGSVFKSQTTFSIEFTGLVPLITVFQTEIESNNTAQLLTIIQGQSIPVSMVVAIAKPRNAVTGEVTIQQLLRNKTKDPVLSDLSENTAVTGDILFIASGYLDETSVVATAGEFIKIKGILVADEVIVGGSGETKFLGLNTGTNQWSYLS